MRLFTGDFQTDYAETTMLLKDKNIKLDVREEIAEEFCEFYQYFDSTKFDKFLKW